MRVAVLNLPHQHEIVALFIAQPQCQVFYAIAQLLSLVVLTIIRQVELCTLIFAGLDHFIQPFDQGLVESSQPIVL